MRLKVITNQVILDNLDNLLGVISTDTINFTVSVANLVNAKAWKWDIDQESLQSGVGDLLVKHGFNTVNDVHVTETVLKDKMFYDIAMYATSQEVNKGA